MSVPSGPRRLILTEPADVRAHFERWRAISDPALASHLDEEAVAYLDYHARRYLHLARVVDAALGRRGEATPPRILDVGPNYQTELLRALHPAGIVDTLGFAHPAFRPRSGERHIAFDLNDAYHRDRWPDVGQYDLIVMAEVIEHLYTAPELILECMSAWMTPRAVLVIQTPNACALHKRLRMLVGRNPYEPIRGTRTNPGHFHEYTPAELRDAAEGAGLRVIGYDVTNYFQPPTRASTIYNEAGRFLPSSLRHGITMCLGPPEGDAPAPVPPRR